METTKSNSNLFKYLAIYLSILATFYTLYLAKPILLPIIIAVFFSLFCSPAVSRLERMKISRQLSSIGVIVLIISVLSTLIYVFTNPAHEWWQKIPSVATEISQSVGEVTKSFQEDLIGKTQGFTGNEQQAAESIREATFISLFKSFVSNTPIVMVQVLATIFMVYFFLVYGQFLLLRLVQLQSSFKDKRRAVDIINTMQAELSSYILTITIINVSLGFVVGLVFYCIGITDAFLWGALAGTLNFAPYVGPLVASVAFSLVAYLEFNQPIYALIVPAIYLAINLIESQFVTPTMLGRKLDLNPLVLFVWLILLAWIWGAFGMLIGVPLLACITIYFEKTGLIGDWYRLVKYKEEALALVAEE